MDRGTFEEQRTTPGRGPAYYLARAGIAAISIEAPLVGPRHPTGAGGGADFFNPTNPVAFRDNVRQAALDFTTLIRMAKTLEVATSSCSGRFDAGNFFFHGHSTGSTIGALVLGMERDIRAGLMSGAGGGWYYNLTIKKAPLDFGALVHRLLEYRDDEPLDHFDPVVNLAQVAWSETEAMSWAHLWPRTLIVEGVVDGFFPPPAVNALAAAADAAPVGPLVDDSILTARREALRGDTGSRFLVQHAPPAGVDGHYVTFELPAPKHQYRCFFESILRTGTGAVPEPVADALAPCP